MAQRYLALLRGINVGGNNLIPMPALRDALMQAGFADVATYIQSGNVLFSTKLGDFEASRKIEEAVWRKFEKDIGVVVFESARWRRIVAAAPQGWGSDDAYRHNLIAVLDREPLEIASADDREIYTGGDQVIYQSLALGYQPKPAPRAIQRRITVRNSNTARKLAELLD